MVPHTMKTSLTVVALLLVLATFDSVRGAAVRPENCKCEDTSVPCTCNILKPPMCMTACEEPKCKNYVQRPGECCPSCLEGDTEGEKICITCPVLGCENPQKLNPDDCCAVCPTTEVCIHDGKKMRVGESSNEDPCIPCTCMSGGRVMCVEMTCPRMLECEKPERVAGNCCATCPLLKEGTAP